MIAANWEHNECLGVMQGTFGDAIPGVRAIVESGKHVPAVRWHLSFCNHNNQCQPGECKPTDLDCMRNMARDIQAFHDQHPNTGCYISPRCEYNERNCARVKSWFDAVASVAPRCVLVASPWGGCVPGSVPLLEKHGNNPGAAHIVSNDGQNYFDSNSVKYNQKGTVINLKWTNRYNLRLTSEKGTAPPPLKRPRSNRVGEQDFKQMQLMKQPLSPMPVPGFCARFRSLRKGEIWKNHAEDYGAKNDARGNKPLLISAKKAARWDIFNRFGKKIACMKYFGPFGSLHRLYVGSCSGDHAVDLYNEAGDWIFVKDGNTCLGLPSIRRWGEYRE